MARKLLVLGESGAGKSYSIRNLDPQQTYIICPDKKELPFKGSSVVYKTVKDENGQVKYGKSNYVEISDMKEIRNLIRQIAEKLPRIKVIIIDTIYYAMVESVMREIKTKDYAKFEDFAQEFFNIIEDIPTLRPDLTVIMLCHTEENPAADGSTQKTSFRVPAGKLTRKTLIPEGKFTVVLYAESQMIEGRPKFFFRTETDGYDTCKAPEGMFPSRYIDNDLKYALECMDNYYKGLDAPAPKIVEVKKEPKDNF